MFSDCLTVNNFLKTKNYSVNYKLCHLQTAAFNSCYFTDATFENVLNTPDDGNEEFHGV